MSKPFWEEGRLKTGYFKHVVAHGDYWDLLIIKMRKGGVINPHKDIAEGRDHFRLNLVIWPARKGGEFRIDHACFRSKYLNFFRPDLCRHEVTKVEEGSRYVLSLGWTTKQ